MRYSVRLTAKADADVDSILHRFSEQGSTVAGERWLRQLLSVLDTLELNPDRCPMAAESADLAVPIRELLLGKRQYKYRLLFIISNRTVYILRVWRAARAAFTSKDL